MVEESSNSNEYPSETERSLETQLTDTPFTWRMSIRTPSWRPPADMYELENAIVVRVEIAGMRENDFSIQLNDRILSIRGSRQDIAERKAYHQMEIRFGEFSIELELPFHIETDKIQATYNNGFLKIVLPKALPRHISVSE
jgi:HSP20 family molecular chaperone IbpA